MREVRAECGDLFQLRIFGLGRVVLVCSPDLLTELFRKPVEEVSAGEVRHKQIGYLIGDQVSLALDGEEYFQRRSVATPLFNGREVLQRAPDIRRIADANLDQWPIDEEFSIQPRFNDISLRVTSHMLYGPSVSGRDDELIRLSAEFLESMNSPLIYQRLFQVDLGRWSPWGRFVAARRRLFDALDTELRRREAESHPEAENLMSRFAHAFGASTPEQRRPILQEIVGFLVGGAETTAKMMTWTLLDLLRNQDAWHRLRVELDEVVGDEPLSPEHFRRLPYLSATIDEGLRFRAPGPIAGMRKTEVDLVLGGFRIPAGTPIAQCFSESGINDYFPRPETYDPDNFHQRSTRMSQYYPFGGGSRICTGMGLAKLELALVIASVARRFDIELLTLTDKPKPEGIGFGPENGLRVRVRPRAGR